jgi:hypothetical protein
MVAVAVVARQYLRLALVGAAVLVIAVRAIGRTNETWRAEYQHDYASTFLYIFISEL